MLHLSDLLRLASPSEYRYGHRGYQQEYESLHLISFARGDTIVPNLIPDSLSIARA